MVEKGSLVIMDILVEAEDGSLINVEMQKHGYDFTGERSCCYMSDLIMRQYTRVKSEKKDKFSYIASFRKKPRALLKKTMLLLKKMH